MRGVGDYPAGGRFVDHTTVMHAGIVGTFLRAPYVSPNAAALHEGGATAAIYGIPWDCTSISRTGANYGPKAIRDASRMQFIPYNATWTFDLDDAVTLVDCGDAAIVPGNAARTFEIVESELDQIHAAGVLPVTLGGDHSITIPAVTSALRRHSDPALVVLDTHVDTALDVSGEKLSCCCPVRRAVEAGVDPTKITLIGISGWENPRPQYEYCLQQGITIVAADEIWERGVWSVAADVRARLDGFDDPLYLSVDMDVVDAAYAPGTCTPTPGGLTSRELLVLVRNIAAHGLLGMDVVETAPSLDPGISTAGLAGRVVMDALACHAGALNGTGIESPSASSAMRGMAQSRTSPRTTTSGSAGSGANES